MSTRYPGGFITKTPTAPTSSAAQGIWTMEQALQNAQNGSWPNANALYSFTAFTFTSANTFGPNPPTLSTLIASYNSSTYPWVANTAYFNLSGNFQLWTVPKTGSYQIVCAGACGGRSYNGGSYIEGGLGAIITSTITLTQGDKYLILVGQKPIDATYTSNGQSNSGGGASAFWSNTATSTPIIVAGAGGGASGNWPGYSYTYTAGQNAAGNGAAGGIGIAPGGYPTAATGGNGGANSAPGAGPGGGWYTAGATVGSSNGASPGQRLYDNAAAGAGGNSSPNGGWGGGGGGRNVIAGGGGGYNGGGCPADNGNCAAGGGGSSYVGGSATFSSSSISNTGNGYVTITAL